MRNRQHNDKTKRTMEPQEPIMPEMPPRGRRPVFPEPEMPTMPPTMPGMPMMPQPQMPPCMYIPIGGMPPTTMQPTMPGGPNEDFELQPGPPVMENTDYLQGYLRSVIGKYVKVNFILGTNMYIDKEGTLVDVGVDHIVLREPQTDDLVVADLYSIKFVTVFY